VNLPSLSVVVPVYNEEKLIARCLNAVLAELAVDEVVVVDNNSTDSTADIVGKIAEGDPRVRLIAEPKQGVVAARNAGMQAAGSELLARIDADSVVSPGWASTIKTFLADHPEYAAITGPIPSDDPKLYPVIRLLGSFGSKSAAEVEFRDTGALLGPNMVVRRDAWDAISGDLHPDADIWEDADVSLCLTKAGLRCAFVTSLQAQVSHRRHLTGWRSFRDYTAQLPRTFSVNGMRLQAAASWSSVWLQRIDYLVYRGIVRRKAVDVDLAIP
jgi:glycosyltransferase involved in cell wall biosynthesis